MSWPSADDVTYWAGIVTIVGFPVAALALVAATRQLSLSQRAGSATALVALHESLQQCWLRYLSSDDSRLAFGDLCNTIEIACAALTDKIFFGESLKILEDYLLNALKLIELNDLARAELLGFLQDPETFINIRRFLTDHRSKFTSLNKTKNQ